MVQIHPTAIVAPAARLGEDVTVGPFVVIEDDVIIGDKSEIAAGAFIDSGSRLGANCKISPHAVLGTAPQDLKYAGEKTYLEVGKNTTVREYATLNRGTTFNYKTVVGSNCLIMAYAHVAHDCIIGNNVIIANTVQMGGHVEIHDNAIIGGSSLLHQFVKIGRNCFIGGGLKVSKDVPPFIRAMGEPVRYGGTNYVGLTRKGLSQEVILEIKRAYRLIYRSGHTMKEAVAAIGEQLQPYPEIKLITEFIEKSERGLIRG